MGAIFGLLGFVASAVAAVIVIGWKNSTHRIVQVPDTKYEYDVPSGSEADAMELKEFLRRKREADATNLDTLYETIDEA